MQINSRFDLNDKNSIPILGFGVYLTPPGSETFSSVTAALKAGYRLIDTASIYKNEADVGLAIQSSHIKREEIFVTTKLWNSDQGYHPALKALASSTSSSATSQVKDT